MLNGAHEVAFGIQELDEPADGGDLALRHDHLAAVGEVETQNGVAGIDDRHVGGGIRLRAGVGLDVDMLGAKELFGAIPGQVLDHIRILTAAVIALAGIALSVFVGENRPHSLKHRLADMLVAVEQVTALAWDSAQAADAGDAAQAQLSAVLAGAFCLDAYVECVVAAKEAGLPVVLGLEVDYYRGRMDDVASLLAGYPFDVLLGSVHWIGTWRFDDVDDDVSMAQWSVRDVDRAWGDYVTAIEELAATGTCATSANGL